MAHPGKSGIGGLAGLPEIEPIFFIFGLFNLNGVVLFQNTENGFHLGLHLFPGVTIGLRENHGLCFREVDIGVLFNRF